MDLGKHGAATYNHRLSPVEGSESPKPSEEEASEGEAHSKSKGQRPRKEALGAPTGKFVAKALGAAGERPSEQLLVVPPKIQSLPTMSFMLPPLSLAATPAPLPTHMLFPQESLMQQAMALQVCGSLKWVVRNVHLGGIIERAAQIMRKGFLVSVCLLSLQTQYKRLSQVITVLIYS